MKELFVDWEKFEELEIEYTLEDCGMSGRYPGWHWFQDDEADIAVYIHQQIGFKFGGEKTKACRHTVKKTEGKKMRITTDSIAKTGKVKILSRFSCQ